ncbi:MAG: hypothetical protein ACYS9T_03465 [Planctomycetota bacterium]
MAKREKKGGQNRTAAVALKRCSRCHKTKELTEFYHDRSRNDGLSSKCKKCEYACRKVRYERLRNRTPDKIPNIASKRCSKCGGVKPVAEFYRVLRNKDGYNNWCKVCCQEQEQFYHRRLAARRKSEIRHADTKKCPKCADVKPISEFLKAVGKVDGHRALCRECDSSSAVHYRKKGADREFEDILPTGKKRCWMCKRNLPVGEFNYVRSNYDGLASHCRECGKEYKRTRYEEYYGEFYNRQVEYRQRYPERRNAFAAVYGATSKGELIRPDTCSKCGNSGYIVAHHHDYSKPLDVVWLCLSCDRQLHADLRRKEKVRQFT